jgi:hypothetical protein
MWEVLPGTSGDLVVTITTRTLMIHMEALTDHHTTSVTILKHFTTTHMVRHGIGLLLICIKIPHLIPPPFFCPQGIRILDPFYQFIVLMLLVVMRIM